jgi:uncharacterized protein YegL
MTDRQVGKREEAQSPEPIQINHIFFVLDKSGSMVGLRKQTVDNFNEQIQNLKADRDGNQVNLISLITFAGSSFIRDVRASQPLSQFEEIKLEEYVPNGSTALYDAIGKAILNADLQFEKYSNFDNAALIVILSDGGENASAEFDNQKITDLIKQRQDGGRFTFTFMGCGEVVRKQAFEIGIPGGNTTVWEYNNEGIIGTMSVNACSTKSFMGGRSAGVHSSSGFYDQPYNADFQATSGTQACYPTGPEDIRIREIK